LNVGIVGGGPVGLFAALVLASLEDFDVTVTVYEKRDTRKRPQVIFIDLVTVSSEQDPATRTNPREEGGGAAPTARSSACSGRNWRQMENKHKYDENF